MTRRELVVRPTAGQWERALDLTAPIALWVGIIALATGVIVNAYAPGAPLTFMLFGIALPAVLIGRLATYPIAPGRATEWSHGYTTLPNGPRNVDFVSSVGEVLRPAGEGLPKEPLPPIERATEPEPFSFRMRSTADFELGRELLGWMSPAPSLTFLHRFDVTVSAEGLVFENAGGPPRQFAWTEVTRLAADVASGHLVDLVVLGPEGPIALPFDVLRERGVFDGHAISAFVGRLADRRPSSRS